MSLFHPPAWFPPQLAFLWPIIWVQVLMLRAQIRAAYGRGVVYRWSVTDNLRVYLVSIEWMPGQEKARTHLLPASHYSDRLAAACDGRASTPEHLRTLPLTLPFAGTNAGRLLALASLEENGSHLPLPET
ncbi:hypothetical protein [Hyphomonas sp.]|uniref:hypothetical protein n=1 Tax=Hyphomonas sp. TaxID=87 RepID=UPI0032421A56